MAQDKPTTKVIPLTVIVSEDGQISSAQTRVTLQNVPSLDEIQAEPTPHMGLAEPLMQAAEETAAMMYIRKKMAERPEFLDELLRLRQEVGYELALLAEYAQHPQAEQDRGLIKEIVLYAARHASTNLVDVANRFEEKIRN